MRNLYYSYAAWTDNDGPRWFTVFSAGTTKPEWADSGYHADSLSDHPGDITTFPALMAFSATGDSAPAVAAYFAYRTGARQTFSGGASILYRRSNTDTTYQPNSAGLPDVAMGALGLMELLKPGTVAGLFAASLPASPILGSPPSSPTGLSASDGIYSNKITLTWSAGTNATGFTVWRNATNNTDTAARIGSATSAAYDDTTAIAGTIYYFWVKATNIAGASAFSGSDSGYIQAPPSPSAELAAPTGLSASDGTYTDKVAVSWAAVSNAGGYEVWRNSSNDSASATRLAAPTGTSYDDTSAASMPNITLYYWVKSTRDAQVSAFSLPDSGYRGNANVTYHPINDYDGDGISDLAIMDGVTGSWYIRSVSGSIIAWATQWGWPGALPVPGDYNGDGVNDLAVFDSNTGLWFVLAADGQTLIAWATAWGWPGAVPVPGDYDGDGKSDFAVFDRNTGSWFVLSADQATILAWAVGWGWPGAQPVPGDYDGDGISDLAVFDSITGYWFIRTVDDSLVTWATAWGWPGAEPVSGDYDGDGLADLAVFDQNTGYWYIQAVTGTLIAWSVQWGWPGAEPVSGDYNGDGISDLAVFDNNTGVWYIRSVAGTVIVWAVPWGWPGAVPVGAAR
ncbi:MAG: VCBS repeat-containing protein [Lentisphaerae bacterium]|nr:VCBS repeat-containing protein [Lentisphaerota bacterium]